MPFVISSALILSWPQIYSSYVERKAARLSISNYSDVEFRVSYAMFTIVLFFSVIFLAMIVWSFFPRGWKFGVPLALFFMFMSVYGVKRLMQERVSITQTEIIYTHGKKQTVVQRDAVKWAYAANGLFVIDTGAVPRVVIPMHFERPALILALLKYSAKSETDLRIDLQ